MRHKIAAGLGAGLIAGLVLGVVMRVLPVTATSGRQTTMIAFAARLVRAGSPSAGWVAYVAYAVVLGALFGASLWGAGRAYSAPLSWVGSGDSAGLWW